ncbi:uncharacterized protein LOC111020465 [Momordica charantia]|uniref:Uncharacterized protein LOC111020465 n=1 Tax=Momordica charantia TaxID=3673 RepID=A0A6J1DFZ6_MOMCH|nr:uncharacterized protein LOC111020465 [Momordica charantia]
MGKMCAAEGWRFTKQVVEGRWFSVFASFVIMIGAGSPYLFGTYSKVIKTQFDYSQTQVNTLGFSKDLGSNLGVFAGLLAEVAPPWPQRGEDFTILQALLSKDMALIFLATVCACGSSIAAIDNLGQIAESLSYPAQSISVFVSWISIFNFFGRVFSGFISETLMTKYKLPRPLMFALAHLLTCIGILFIAFPYHGSVYVASLIIGFGFGAQVPLLFAIISDLFGLKHYSTLLNCGQLAVPLGSYVLNVLLIGRMYDMEATRTGNTKNGKGLTCSGAHCFNGSFTILATITLFGAISSLALAYRTRGFYKGAIYQRYRDDMWITQSDMELYSSNTMKNNEFKKNTEYR